MNNDNIQPLAAQNPPTKKSLRQELLPLVIILIAIFGVNFVAREPFFRDTWRGFSYQPDTGVAQLEESLALTSTGKRVFAATHPTLEDSDSFNTHCESYDAEVSLLGCYTDGDIYIYKIQRTELKPANQVTAAHELLHAVWERLKNSERNYLTGLLEELYVAQPDWFDSELESYSDEERIEEIYTRAGTKLRDLPAELESHYAKYFTNRLAIVDAYEAYQAPFQNLQQQLKSLESQIVREKDSISEARSNYLAQLDQLNQRIGKFNQCANVAGCFSGDGEFNRERSSLLAAERELDQLRSSINQRIDQNNQRIEDYRNLQIELGELTNAMNSNSAIMETLE